MAANTCCVCQEQAAREGKSARATNIIGYMSTSVRHTDMLLVIMGAQSWLLLQLHHIHMNSTGIERHTGACTNEIHLIA